MLLDITLQNSVYLAYLFRQCYIASINDDIYDRGGDPLEKGIETVTFCPFSFSPSLPSMKIYIDKCSNKKTFN